VPRSEEPVLEESTRQSSVDGEPDSAMGIAQRIYRLGNQAQLNRTTSAFPGGETCVRNAGTRSDRTQRQPVAAILGFPLPTLEIMQALLEEYFDKVHWFSLVIYDPRFRPVFSTIEDVLVMRCLVTTRVSTHSIAMGYALITLGIMSGLLVNPVFIKRFFSEFGGANGSLATVNPSITGISVACLQASAAVGALIAG
nr:hypothetical protein [Tanacetum cinerariifolium]